MVTSTCTVPLPRGTITVRLPAVWVTIVATEPPMVTRLPTVKLAPVITVW